MDNRNILKEYEELTNAEKAAVDTIVENYKSGVADPENYTVMHGEEDDNGKMHFIERNVAGSKDINGDDIINYMSKFAPHIAQVNEKLKSKDNAGNKELNDMRMKLFEDRWKNGYYSKENPPMNQAPVNVNISNGDSAEVKALKEEVSSLKSDINDLKQLLIEKLK